MITEEQEKRIEFLKKQLSQLRKTEKLLTDKREKIIVKGLCPKKDSCDQCRNARMSSPEWRESLDEIWQVRNRIENIKTGLDILYRI